MLREVPAALEEMLQDQKVRVIVFASAIEKYFSTGTRDFSEGIQAFLEKRKPDWE
jgi:enoyl-CoA hydratase/carnithine racemase